MYSKKSHTVIGFHGCDLQIAEALISGNTQIKKSEETYDWLGSGMYFWENNLNRAWEWAEDYKKRNKIATPAVVGALLDLGTCLDFMDSNYLKLLKLGYERLKELNNPEEMPKNEHVRGSSDYLKRHLDCAVIETILKDKANEGLPFDSVRAVFWEGEEPYKNAGFKEKNHIQISIINPNCIKGFFKPRKLDTAHNKP